MTPHPLHRTRRARSHLWQSRSRSGVVDDRTGGAVAVRIAVREKLIDILLKSASADSVAKDGDFPRLSLRLLV